MEREKEKDLKFSGLFSVFQQHTTETFHREGAFCILHLGIEKFITPEFYPTGFLLLILLLR